MLVDVVPKPGSNQKIPIICVRESHSAIKLVEITLAELKHSKTHSFYPTRMAAFESWKAASTFPFQHRSDSQLILWPE